MIDRLAILWHYLAASRSFTRWRDPSALQAWQEHQVQRHIKRVSARSPFFHRLAEHHGANNWRHWPVNDKSEMMRHFNEWNTAGLHLEEAWDVAVKAERTRDFSPTLKGITVGLSSGTSGSRGLFLASESERRLWAGTLLSRVLRGTLTDEHRAALFLRADSALYRTVGSRRFKFGFFDLMEPLEKQWQRLQALRPTILAAPPSVLSQLAEFPGAAKLMSPPGLLLSVADVLDDSERERIESGFQTKLGQIYQATEGFLAATCPFGRLHWNEDAVIVEQDWLDEAHTRYAPIITDFRRFTQPIIRYRLDDVIVVDKAGPCPCGSVFSTLGAIEGRCDDRLVLTSADGTEPVTIFPDFVRRAIILAVPAGIDFTVAQVTSTQWNVSLSRDCALEPIQREVDLLCQRLAARPPQLRRVAWTAPVLSAKRRRVRCDLPPTQIR